MGTAFWVIMGLVAAMMIAASIADRRSGFTAGKNRLASAQAAAAVATRRARDSQITCPHCRTTGQVHPTHVRLKRGISGGKATGAILTGGLSMLATGLSRKETVTRMHCGNCGTTWTV